MAAKLQFIVAIILLAKYAKYPNQTERCSRDVRVEPRIHEISPNVICDNFMAHGGTHVDGTMMIFRKI